MAGFPAFSVVREMILDDLSARDPDRLARVEGIDVSYTLYRQLRTAGAFEDLAFYYRFGDRIWRTVAGIDGAVMVAPLEKGVRPKHPNARRWDAKAAVR